MAAAALGAAHVYATDLAYCLDNARENVKLNAASLQCTVQCLELDWYKPELGVAALERPVDLIVGADIVCA